MSHEEHASPDERPQVFALSRKGSSWALSRRGFLGGAAGATALAAGCGGDEVKTGNGSATGNLVDAGAGNAFAAPKNEAAVPSGPQDSCQGQAHSLNVRKIALSQDGKFLASAGADSRVKIWSIPDGALVHSLSASTSSPRGLAINRDGSRVLITSSASRVQYWDLSQRNPSSRSFRVDTSARCFGFVNATDLIAVGNTRGEVFLYSVPSGLKKETLKFDDRTIVDRVLSSWDGKWIAATASNRNIHFWSIPDGKTRLALTAPVGKTLTAFDLSRDLQMSAAGHSDSTVSIWSGAAATPKTNYTTLGGLINTIRVTTDGRRIVTFDSRRKCRTSASDTGAELGNFTVNDSTSITDAEITPDGKYLIVAYGNSISLHAIDKKTRDKCLMDVAASNSNTKGIKYQATDSFGHTVTYTLPCGSPIPAGAVCTCNCVPGSIRTTVGSTTYRPTYRPSTYRPTYRPSTYRPSTYRPTYRPPTYSPRTYTRRYWYPN